CYVFQHFLQSPILKKEGINSFDEWVSGFGNISLALEVKPTGSGWRMRERSSEFKNLPELCNMLSQCFDLVKTKDINGISLPKIAGGKPEIVVCEQSEDQAVQVAEGMERASKIERRAVTQREDNMPAVCSFMSKVSLDPRINNPNAEDWDGLKVNECAKSIISIYKQHPDSAQVVFCDLSTPNNEGFNVYKALKDRLLKSGEFKPEEIAFVHDANNDKQRLKMFDKVNNAQIKVIIGSTSKLGTGVNMQKKLIAAHHLDAPYVPKDIEQRNGRIVRQGNENSEVKIRCYSTKGTFDSYRWQLLEKKQQLIAQVLSGKPPARNCKDIDETALTFAEMKAATADNPLIAEKMQVDNEVDRLKLLESDWISQQSR
ncbi:MAG: helicase, partial [Ruminiclostridium sp.]|nr:helicase [Ruminiclostridium sp.]